MEAIICITSLASSIVTIYNLKKIIEENYVPPPTSGMIGDLNNGWTLIEASNNRNEIYFVEENDDNEFPEFKIL